MLGSLMTRKSMPGDQGTHSSTIYKRKAPRFTA